MTLVQSRGGGGFCVIRCHNGYEWRRWVRRFCRLQRPTKNTAVAARYTFTLGAGAARQGAARTADAQPHHETGKNKIGGNAEILRVQSNSLIDQ